MSTRVEDLAPIPDPDDASTPLDVGSLARELMAEDTLDALLQRVVDASIANVEGAEHAGVTILTESSVTTPAASDDLVIEIDRRQYGTGQGPCLTAALEQLTVVRVPDLAVDPRWPAFTAAVEDLDVRSVLSFQLYTGEDTIGALNLYASGVDAFTDESVYTGQLLAAHAAVAAVAAEKSGQLRSALRSRDVIGQAKGILMERYKITADQAFEVLIQASQRSNRKLHVVAEDLTTTGQLSTVTP